MSKRQEEDCFVFVFFIVAQDQDGPGLPYNAWTQAPLIPLIPRCPSLNSFLAAREIHNFIDEC